MIAILGMFKLVPRWCWEVLMALALLLAYGLHERGVGERLVQARWDAATLAANRAAKIELDAATLRTKTAESTMKTRIQEANDERDKKLAVVNGKLAVALNELRTRLARRADANPQGAGTVCQCAGASGTELSRADAGFLAGEAARADGYVIELNACNARYDGVVREINNLSP